MSYDIAIFCGDPLVQGVEQAQGILKIIEGVSGAKGAPSEQGSISTFNVSSWGLQFSIHPRFLFLTDAGEMKFSRFSCQVDIASSSSGGLVHPIGVHLAQTISRVTGGPGMLCFAGVEILAAVFERGVLAVNHIADAQRRIGGPVWVFSG